MEVEVMGNQESVMWKLVPVVRRRVGIYWSDGVMLVSGCSRVREECEHCWALRYEKRFGINGGVEGVVRFHLERLRRAVRCRSSQVYSIWNDFYHEGVGYEERSQAYEMMMGEDGSRHYFIILTKRPFRMYSDVVLLGGGVSRNILLGVTAGLQKHLDWQYEEVLLELNRMYGMRFVLSVEPILGPIEFPAGFERVVSWAIVGVETGPGSRVDERSEEWIEGIVERCEDMGIPVFMKSLPGFYKGEVIRQFPVAEG